MGRRFKKIKFDGKNVTLLWEEGDYYQNEYSLKCDELPAPGMVKAFDELRYEALLLCELPDEYLDRIDVRSVSLNYGGPEETMGATITARMQLFYSNAPLNLNTPNKPVEPYSAECEYDDEVLAKMCLREECINKLEDLINEANRYVDGERAQGKLFEDKEPNKEEGANPPAGAVA